MSTIASKTKEQIKQLRVRAELHTVRNDIEGYNSFWADDELVDLYLEPGRIANFRLIAELAADWGGETIDLGCGCGTMLAELLKADRTGNKKITGIDFSASSIARCRRNLPHGVFLERDLCQTALPAESFDLLLSIQTMEHLPHPADAMDEMWRLMRPAAKLVITVPNGETDRWEGHCNFWTIESFLEMAGRKPQCIAYINDNRNLLFVFQKPQPDRPHGPME